MIVGNSSGDEEDSKKTKKSVSVTEPQVAKLSAAQTKLDIVIVPLTERQRKARRNYYMTSELQYH